MNAKEAMVTNMGAYMEGTIFIDVVLYSVVGFGGIYTLHLQGRK
jgi:hypothetical protein